MLINCVFDSIHSSLGVRRYCGLRPTHTRVPPGLFGVLPYLAPRAPRARPRGPSSVFCCVRAVPLRRPLALAWYVSTIRVRSGNSSPLEFWAHEATGVRSWKRCAQSNGATSTGLISWSWRGQADRSVTVAVSNQIMMIFSEIYKSLLPEGVPECLSPYKTYFRVRDVSPTLLGWSALPELDFRKTLSADQRKNRV